MRYLSFLILFCLIGLPAQAAGIKYYEDPVYQKMAPEDPHPMEDLLTLAEQGDVRAQYIIADMFGKGKGGLGRNQVKARYWFETAARKGYTMGFIRLAAMAKRQRDYVSAYKWYSLSMKDGTSRERKWSEAARDEMVKAAKMSRQDIRDARDATDLWLQNKRQALSEDSARSQNAQEAAKLKNDDTPKVIGGPARNVNTSTSTSTSPQKPSRKEHLFNE
ncbi:MAG TPA: hypothetical protein VEF76_00470 [Patescibacteria group bacterium]|nr:hypothetical protein [Patescibacteria group bacterium]